jgi:RimJ/RimL family protein N-acetyltransferase
MIKLRPVSNGDCRLIWQWANDPEVRAVSFSSDSIPFENHVKWFEAKLNDPNCCFYVAENRQHESVGQVRFDIKGKHAVISISLDRKFRSQGYGSKLIQLASQKILEVSNVAVIHAYVKKENLVSLKAFQKVGFNILEDTFVKAQPAHHLVRKKKCNDE